MLHCIIFGKPPQLPQTDEEIAKLWYNARVMHNPKAGDSVQLPSVEDVEYLWNVAKITCINSSSKI